MKKNFSFIEILATLAIIGASLFPIINMLMVGKKQSIDTQYIVSAYYLATEKMEMLKLMPFSRIESDINIYQSIYDETFQPEYKLCDEDAAEFNAKFSDIFTESFYKDKNSDYEKIYLKFKNKYKTHFKFDDGYLDDEIDDYELYSNNFSIYRRITEVVDVSNLSDKEVKDPIAVKKATVKVFLNIRGEPERLAAELTRYFVDN